MRCFVILLVQLVTSIESEKSFNFYVNSILDNFLIEDDIIRSLHAESLSKCAMMCIMSENCHSVSYNEDAKECKNYSVTKRYSLPGSATAGHGWRHYFTKEAGA